VNIQKKQEMKRKASTNKRKSQKRSKMTEPLFRSEDLKICSLSRTPIGVSTAGRLDSMFPSARGTDSVNQFIGNRLTPVNFTMRWAWTWGDTHNFCRICVFQLLGGGTPTLSNFFLSPTFADSPLNNSPTLPFNCLADIYVGVHSEEPTFAVGTVKCGKIYVKGKKLVQQLYPSGAFTLPTAGCFYIACITDSLAPPNPNISYYAQFKFTDV